MICYDFLDCKITNIISYTQTKKQNFGENPAF